MHSEVETQLAYELLTLPQRYHLKWTETAERDLRRILFRSLSNYNQTYFRLFFPDDFVDDANTIWSLRDAQGGVDGAEYMPSARGTACGHIFKIGESTYSCKTCQADDTCVLCTKCFESSDHEGHQVYIQISPGNSGCCDCGDHEAWKKEILCSIHTDPTLLRPGYQNPGKAKEQPNGSMDTSASSLPHDLVHAIRMTIARSLDFMCDVFSCSPEQMRLPKTELSVRKDEERSRLSSTMYGTDDVNSGAAQEFCLVLWNDEKHTIDDVMNQVARACALSKHVGREKAMEVNDVGRSIIYYSTDVKRLIEMATVIEQLKLTVTIRSSRDTFREQMCATIVSWLADIAGCSVGSEPCILRNIVCEEMLQPWRVGSRAGNKTIGHHGIDDHEEEDREYNMFRTRYRNLGQMLPVNVELVAVADAVDEQTDEDDDNDDDDFNDNDDNVDETDDVDDDDLGFEAEDMDLDNEEALPRATNVTPLTMDIELVEDDIDVTEVMEARHAGYPAPPPPPRRARAPPQSPMDSDDADVEATALPNAPFGKVPKTPKAGAVSKKHFKVRRHWIETPEAFKGPRPSIPCEDLWQRIRLDWMILYDLRLWKTLRIELRHLYISTVVLVPQFKRIISLRFAGLYTPLAELYLIADREPDHSIINLSLQMLTTPSITEEVVERGNFLTNLMAILYTFLTTRQVGYPDEVNPQGTLAFDAGSVTNRRIFHFFLDLRWLFHSEYVQRRVRTEHRYLLQFLELVKLHQGTCPNTRAVGEHVEYESDSWISASLIVKEVNKLCRQVALSFNCQDGEDNSYMKRAIRTVAQVALSTTLGFERRRFSHAEVKEFLGFHAIGPFTDQSIMFRVPEHVVQKEPISFHHPLHYLLSWLIEHGIDLGRDELKALLEFEPTEYKDPLREVRVNAALPSSMSANVFMSAIFDPPLRVAAWLAQNKAGMWVRNGITLRHQVNAYRGVPSRDIGFQRDIFMIQTGLTLMTGNEPVQGNIRQDSFLAQMIDRFQMVPWMRGDYAIVEGFEESQQLDVLEDFYHLLVIALSERSHLLPKQSTQELADNLLQHDIAHALCFQPLSHSDITSKVTEKVHESDHFDRVLEQMAVYRAPEGLSDTGVFELKPEFIELVDPYSAYYPRNTREEAEKVYRKYKAHKTGQQPEDIVYEPKLQRIEAGLFKDLTAFTRNSLFVQVIFAGLQYSYLGKSLAPNVPATRVETFLHMVLHLLMIAVIEDRERADTDSFILLAASESFAQTHRTNHTLITILEALSNSDACGSCYPTIKRILHLMCLKQPARLASMINEQGSASRARTDSPASLSADEREKKKQAALARQARVMAQMKEQQNSFLKNQGLSEAEASNDLDDFEDKMSIAQDDNMLIDKPDVKHWDFPSGTCILCQESTDEQRVFGTFAYVDNSNILRSTPVRDPDYIDEVLNTPVNLDEPYEDRPFGVASENKLPVLKRASDGTPALSYKQQLSKGFPQSQWCTSGPVSTGCGHMMHYKCFEVYYNATTRRHQLQIARNHPEDIFLNEFICPLCKALGNTFLPIVWKTKECQDVSSLSASSDLTTWLQYAGQDFACYPLNRGNYGSAINLHMLRHERATQRLRDYARKTFHPQLFQQIGDKSVADDDSHLQRASRHPLRRPTSISSFMRFNRNFSAQSGMLDSRFGLARDGHSEHKQELGSAYNRAHDTFSSIKLVKPQSKSNATIEVVEVLAQALGISVSACEISHRGAMQAGNYAESHTLVDMLPEQTVTHLRVLCETAETALAISGLDGMSCQFGIEVETVNDLVKWQDRLRQQLFGDAQLHVDIANHEEVQTKVMLATDSFLLANNWLVAYSPSIEEAVHIMRLCLWVEIVKSIFVLTMASSARGPASIQPAAESFVRGVNTMLHACTMSANQSPDASFLPQALNADQYARLQLAVHRYALAFVRKCLVLLHIRYGVDFAAPAEQKVELDELTRTCRLLHIEHPMVMMETFIAAGPASDVLRSLTQGWLATAVDIHIKDDAERKPLMIQLPHPAIFELIGLPRTYDTLTEEAIRRRCPTTGRELTDPALCLLCGDIFCSQAVCCMLKDDRGGCWQHMQRCGLGNMGMFINIRKCMVLFMHGSNGSWLQAPYLDKHGEPDPTLRRHHQLFLNQKRYDKLIRDVWLAHGVQNVISRKLEADINPGGWETL